MKFLHELVWQQIAIQAKPSPQNKHALKKAMESTLFFLYSHLHSYSILTVNLFIASWQSTSGLNMTNGWKAKWYVQIIKKRKLAE